jgi:hypothetical protein
MIFWSKHYRSYFLECEVCHKHTPYERKRGPIPLYCAKCKEIIDKANHKKGNHKYWITHKADVQS